MDANRSATPLTESQLKMLEAGAFRFDGFSEAHDVVSAYALIRAGYVRSNDVGGGSYTLIHCEISDSGREILAQAGRRARAPGESSRFLVL
jgi:hypothetical protein